MPSLSFSLGRFRQRFGVLNRWHEHDLDQVSYPIPIETLLGPEGLVGNGLDARWFMPRLWAHAQDLTIEVADGGTLFLDEVGDLPLAHQGKLLGVLENQRFSRVGASEDIRVDVRVIGATNRDLSALVASGLFREDLYYRLAVFPIRVVPLRERPQDLPDLVEQLLRRIAYQIGRPGLAMDPDLLGGLAVYSWPGNVRELRNVIERAAVLSPGQTIRALPLDPVSTGRPAADARIETGRFQEAVDAFKVRRLVAALEETGWCKQEAARRLGLSPRALSHYVRFYDLDRYRRHGGDPAPA